jgi:CBS domain-containing protein
MRITDVLRHKGDLVVTIRPDAPVRDLLAQLAQFKIGALIVGDDSGQIVGIVSERDVVRHLHEAGPSLLDLTVSQIMTSDVTTCSPGDSVDDLMALMTQRRFRHVPVVDDAGSLIGIVSIGDVVKNRIDELQLERDQLTAYINS